MTTFHPTRHVTSRGSHVERHAAGLCTGCRSPWPRWRAQTDDPSTVAARTTALSLGIPRC